MNRANGIGTRPSLDVIERMREEAVACDEYNRTLQREFIEKWTELLKRAVEMWGEGSKEAKYVSEHKPNWYTSNHSARVDILLKAWDESEKRAAAVTLEKKREADFLMMTIEATRWLENRGKFVGADYRPEGAIKYANHLAYEEEVTRRQKEMQEEDEFIDFPGSDYCEGCPGWDGEDRRCGCQNVRVCWEPDTGHSFKEPRIVPMNF